MEFSDLEKFWSKATPAQRVMMYAAFEFKKNEEAALVNDYNWLPVSMSFAESAIHGNFTGLGLTLSKELEEFLKEKPKSTPDDVVKHYLS